MSSQILLSGGDKYYSYSGEIFGDVSVPATIPMITIDNTGLRDSLVVFEPFFDYPPSFSAGTALGFEIKLDNVTIYKNRGRYPNEHTMAETMPQLFIPRNSKLEVISINTSANNTQIRGVNLIGYYL